MIPGDIRLEDKPCPNQCPAGDVRLFSAHDRLNGRPGEFTLVRCRTCGLVRTNPRPAPESMGFYYPETYSPYATSQIVQPIPAPPTSLLRSLRRAIGRFFRFNMVNVPPVSIPGRMLEIGCASGSFLAEMAAKGWDVEGIEFSTMAAGNARDAGFKVQNTSIEQAQAPQLPFDLVVGWMVLEHLHEPVASLRKLAEWSAPHARLAISVPNAGSLDFPLFRGAGYALQVPTHLYHFSPTTLTALLARGGWTVDNMFHQRILGNHLGSIGLLLEDWGAPERVSRFFRDLPARGGYLNHALYPLAWPMALFGQTGRMTVWAHKAPGGGH